MVAAASWEGVLGIVLAGTIYVLWRRYRAGGGGEDPDAERRWVGSGGEPAGGSLTSGAVRSVTVRAKWGWNVPDRRIERVVAQHAAYGWELMSVQHQPAFGRARLTFRKVS